jgi:5-(carboxyamino)imidazole ribonucleotide synthase
LAVTQDRLTEKTFIRDLGLPVPDFRAIDSLEDLKAAAAAMGGFGVLKTRRFGYDGKGQAMIRPDTDLAAAWEKVGKAASILEAFVPFDRECSVIAARSANGDSAAYELCENEHRHHILARTTLPASVPAALGHEAMAIGETIAAALDYVGVIAVELFVAGDRLLVNEIAPRVHNSGHWTIEGAETSQFENHIRAVAGWPLGITRRRARIVMDNLIGDEADRWEARRPSPPLWQGREPPRSEDGTCHPPVAGKRLIQAFSCEFGGRPWTDRILSVTRSSQSGAGHWLCATELHFSPFKTGHRRAGSRPRQQC